MDEIKTYDARDIGVVTAEIKTLNQQYRVVTVSYAIEVGRRLTEAKSLLHHGEWGDWLEHQVNFSQRTAINFMKVFEEYGDQQISLFGDSSNPQAIANLPITKVLKLLALPSDERDEFLAETDVEAMSARELEAAIKARKDAEARADVAEQAKEALTAELSKASARIDDYEHAEGELRRSLIQTTAEREKLAADLENAKKDAEKARADLNKAKKDPKIPQATMEQFRKDAEAAATKKYEDANAAAEARVAEALKKQADAEKREAELRRQLESVNRDAKLGDPDILAFKLLFEQIQQDAGKLAGIYDRINERSPDTAEKLRGGIRQMIERCFPFLAEA